MVERKIASDDKLGVWMDVDPAAQTFILKVSNDFSLEGLLARHIQGTSCLR